MRHKRTPIERARQFARLMALVFISVLAAACARESSVVDGGQDAGGGNVQMSSPEQVRTVFDRAWKLALEPDAYSNVYFTFVWTLMTEDLHDRQPKSDSEHRQRRAVFNKAFRLLIGFDFDCHKNLDRKGCEKAPRSIGEFPKVIGAHFVPMLQKSPIKVLDKGSCSAKGNLHADASVAAFKPGSEICFSLDKLRRLPPNVLLKEILGLIWHEAAHLSGYQENDAMELQAAFTEYFEYRFGELSRLSFLRRTDTALKLVGEHLQTAWHQSNGSTPSNVWAHMGRISQLLMGMPNWNDAVGMKLILTTEDSLKEKAINAYSNSVMDTILYVRGRFGVAPLEGVCLRDSRSPDRCLPPPNDKSMREDVQAVMARFDVVLKNWRAVVSGGDFICVPFPENVGDLMYDDYFELSIPRVYHTTNVPQKPRCD